MELQTSKLGKVGITVEKDPWVITKSYDKLVIVRVEEQSATYISRKEVPANTPILDTEYWIELSSTPKKEIEPNHVCYIINQSADVKDPNDRVSHNFIKNELGELIEVSENGFTGNSKTNFLTWLREHTHAYVGVYDENKNIAKLKQLDDKIYGKFSDGTDATSYLTSDNPFVNIWLKFDVDIYFKTEQYPLESNNDSILVTIAKERLDTENWQYVSKHTLIGVYEGSLTDNNDYYFARSIAKAPVFTETEDMPFVAAMITATQYNQTSCSYKIHQLMAYLFYGYYGTLDSQSVCGYGTQTYSSATNKFYAKDTAIAEIAPMIDTDVFNGTNNTTDNTIIESKNNASLKSIRFWGLENWWGNVQELMFDVKISHMLNPNPENSDSDKYVSDLIKEVGPIVITINGNDTLMSHIPDSMVDDIGVVIHDFLLEKYRVIHLGQLDISNVPTKLIFGDNADLIPINNLNLDTSIYYTDTFTLGKPVISSFLCRGGYSNVTNGGISSLEAIDINSDTGSINNSKVGFRLMYYGDSIIVDDLN